MPVGKLKTWNTGKGWGFLSTQNQPDTFVHVSQFGSVIPSEGAYYEYQIADNPRTGKTHAVSLKKCNAIESYEAQAWENPKPVKFGSGEMPD